MSIPVLIILTGKKQPAEQKDILLVNFRDILLNLTCSNDDLFKRGYDFSIAETYVSFINLQNLKRRVDPE